MVAKIKDKKETDRIICIIAGDSGSGKTFFSANLPNAIIFDADLGGGAAYADALIEKMGSRRIEVLSFKDIQDSLMEIIKTGEKVKNIVIDPVTPLHQRALIDFNFSGKKDYGYSGNLAKREWLKIIGLVAQMDCNVYCNVHLKGEWEGGEEIGKVSDGAKNIEADANVVLYLKRKKGEAYPANAVTIKWRRLPDDPRGPVPAVFPFTLDNFQKIAGSGMVRESKQYIVATPEQVAEVKRLLEVIKIGDETIDKWFTKAGVDKFEDMETETIGKCIAYLKNQVGGEKK